MNRGFIQMVVLIIAGIFILSLFGIDLQTAVQEPLVKKNLTFVWDGVKYVWTEYVYLPISRVGTHATGASTTPDGMDANIVLQ